MLPLAVAQVRANPKRSRRRVLKAHPGGDVEQTAQQRRKLKVRLPVDVGLVPIGEDPIADLLASRRVSEQHLLRVVEQLLVDVEAVAKIVAEDPNRRVEARRRGVLITLG